MVTRYRHGVEKKTLLNWLKHGVLALCFGVVVSSSLYAQESLSGVSEELQSLSSKMDSIREKSSSKKQKKKHVEKEYNKLARDLKLAELRLTKAKKEFEKSRSNLRVTGAKVEEMESKLSEKKMVFSKRLVEIYKQKDTALLQFFLMPEKAHDIANASYYFEKLVENDLRLISEIKESKLALENEKKRYKKETDRLNRLKTTMATQEQTITKKKNDQNRLIKTLSREIALLDQQYDELEASSQKLSGLIMKLGQGKEVFYGTGSMIRPVKTWISSYFGTRKHPISKKWRKHNGIDFGAPEGYRIKAADSGIVIVAGDHLRQYRGYGKITVIDHGKRAKDGKRVSTFYAHQSRILVKEGDLVKKGQEIGWVGSTGYSTGPHLHFEVRENGVPVDPLLYVPKR